MTVFIRDRTSTEQGTGVRRTFAERLMDAVTMAGIIAFALGAVWLTTHSAFAFDEGTLRFF